MMRAIVGDNDILDRCARDLPLPMRFVRISRQNGAIQMQVYSLA